MTQQIKFINKDKLQFAATLRKNVNAYFKEKNISIKGNWKTILKSIIMFMIYMVPFVLLITAPINVWYVIPLFIIMGIGKAGMGMSVMHEGVHGSSTDKVWLNKLLGGSMYILGSNVFNWKIQHNVLHHAFTNIDGHDEDIASRFMLRLSQHAPLKKVHRFQYIYAFFLYSIFTLVRIINDFQMLWQYKKEGHTDQHKIKLSMEYVKMTGTKLAYFFIVIGLPLLLTSFNWWLILLGFLFMHMTAGIIMGTIFQMAHQVEGADQPLPNAEGNMENEWAIHQLHTTANFARDNRWLSWFIGGLNFQIEHHLFPNINHIHYRNLSLIVEKTAKDFGLPYNYKASFRHAFVSHVRTLKALGRR